MAKHTIAECENMIQWFSALKSILVEGERLIEQGGLIEADEVQQNRIAKIIYTTMQSAPKAADWIFAHVKEYAINKTRAKARLQESLQTDCCGDPKIDSIANDVRTGNVTQAMKWWS